MRNLRIPSPVDHDSEVPPIIIPMIGEVVPPARCGAVQAERNKARKDDDDESRYLADVIDFGSER